MIRRLPIALLLLALIPLPAAAQDRPSEQEMFGQPAPAAEKTAAGDKAGTAAPAPGRSREDEMFGAPAPQGEKPAPSATAARLDEKASADPLKIGGQLYLRANLSARRDQPPSQWYLSSPDLVDAYFDVRPNDRVRGYLLGRMSWDPTVNAGEPGQYGIAQGSGGPTVLLDQLWVAFDVARTVFVTAGRQHVKWGTGHFWNPTDWLHPVRRDPLALFDSRTGTTMLRLHLPWEKRGWSLTAVALLEGAVPGGTQVDAENGATSAGTPAGAYANADQLGKVAGAARAEMVLGAAEIGLDVITRRGGGTKAGIDISAGIWELDVLADVAIKTGTDVPLWRLRAVDPPGDLINGYEPWSPTGLTPAATLGASWSYKYSDEDTLTIGGEYYFNSNGYDDPKIYPYLLGQQFVTGANAFTPFYLGRHYGGLYLLLPKPGNWNDTTITVSTLANLSDLSFISRLDWQVTLLTYLSLEAYGQVHYGSGEGEFRLGIELPSFSYCASATCTPVQHTPEIHLAPPTFDVGVNLRVRI